MWAFTLETNRIEKEWDPIIGQSAKKKNLLFPAKF